jgi:hypothetical protein
MKDNLLTLFIPQEALFSTPDGFISYVSAFFFRKEIEACKRTLSMVGERALRIFASSS